MIKSLMFASFYSCYTLGVVQKMCDGQLVLVQIPKDFIGATYIELLNYYSGGAGGYCVAVGLYRPVGTLHSKLPYVYTAPLPRTVLVEGDYVYLLQPENFRRSKQMSDAATSPGVPNGLNQHHLGRLTQSWSPTR